MTDRDDRARELAADVYAGRGRIPRDKAGNIAPGFLEAARARGGAAMPLSEILKTVVPPAPPPPANDVERLELLERELAALLETAAPHLWQQIRAPLRRLLRRARLELRGRL